MNLLQDIINRAAKRPAPPPPERLVVPPSKGMCAALMLEVIGENYRQAARELEQSIRLLRRVPASHRMRVLDTTGPWVARITGRHPTYGLARVFMKGRRDWRHSNGTGSRGVFLCFMLPEGYYEVFATESWRRSRRYFIRSEAGITREITTTEMDVFLDGSADP